MRFVKFSVVSEAKDSLVENGGEWVVQIREWGLVYYLEGLLRVPVNMMISGDQWMCTETCLKGIP